MPTTSPRGTDPDSRRERPVDRAVAGPASGITLMELLIVMGVISVLAAISVNVYADALARARVTRAIADIRNIEAVIVDWETDDELPASLADIGWDTRVDPWGNPYQYVNFALAAGPSGNVNGIARKDRFLVPINSSYDLYSMGPDGRSKKPLTAKDSRDDILRAADGGFIGIAEDF